MPFYVPLSRASTMGRWGPIDCGIRVGKPSMIGSVSSVNAAINGIFGRLQSYNQYMQSKVLACWKGSATTYLLQGILARFTAPNKYPV